MSFVFFFFKQKTAYEMRISDWSSDVCSSDLTVGPKEARAWTVRRGAKAPEAAGVIHTDFERGFIRAETIAYADFAACNGEQGAKDAGKMRAEGKEYVVQDGDVFHFRFNV